MELNISCYLLTKSQGIPHYTLFKGEVILLSEYNLKSSAQINRENKRLGASLNISKITE